MKANSKDIEWLLENATPTLIAEKSQLLIENQASKIDIPHEWQNKQEVLENQVNYYRNSANNANQRVREYQDWVERAEKGSGS